MKFISSFLLFMSFLQGYSRTHDESLKCYQEPIINFHFLDGQLLETVQNLKNCPAEDEKTLKLVSDEYKKFYSHLKKKPHLLKGFKLSSSLKEYKIAKKALGRKPPKAWSKSAKDCETLLCAFGKLLGSKKAAMQLFNIKAKSSYYFSLDQTINQSLKDQTWSAKELQEMDAAINKLPKQLRHLKVRKIERLADGLRKFNHRLNVAAYANLHGDLVLYDSGAKGSPVGKNSYTSTSWPQEVLIHELCHHHDFKHFSRTGNYISERRGSNFGKISGWKEKTTKSGEPAWSHSSKAKFVSDYASTSPAEDYAESCMNYLLHPSKLKKKAPKKYAYMKKNIFKNKDFLKAPWTKKGKHPWPKLDKRITDESFCNEKLNRCMNKLEFGFGIFCDRVQDKKSGSVTHSTCGNLEALIYGNPCIQKERRKAIDKISKDLAQEEKNFCALGGPARIKQRKDDICKKAIKSFVSKATKYVKKDISKQIAHCEQSLDYTKSCIFKELSLSKSEKALSQIVEKKIPNRLNSLSNKLKDYPTNDWLKPCFEMVKNIEHFKIVTRGSGQERKEDIFSYTHNDHSIDSSYLGRHIYVTKASKKKSVNTSCANKVVKSLKSKGIKISDDENSLHIMGRSFLQELTSFEQEVLLKVSQATKGCLFGRCKRKAILRLLKQWENKEPQRRKGFSTKQFAKEISSKLILF